MSFVLLLIGFVILIFGADRLVEASASLARKFKVPDIAIGLTIVAFGTSAPELVVNTFAAINGSGDIALGNIVGSNIFNILVILGLSAMIFPLQVKTKTTWIEIPLTLIAGIVIFLFANDLLIDKQNYSAITRIDGIIMLLFFIIFTVYTFSLMKQGDTGEDIPTKNYKMITAVSFIILGIFCLVMGGKLIVDNAVMIAKGFGISERIIAITIISAGTSLPELATSLVAAFKKNTDIAVGNIVGSNIFNVFLIGGISSTIRDIPLSKGANLDLALNIIATVLLFIFVFTGKGRRISRIEGGIFFTMYIGYIIYIL